MNQQATQDTPAVASLPCVPISWGELFDKIAILQIKEENLASERAIANVRRELALLRGFADKAEPAEDLPDLVAELEAVNKTLWTLEDEIREKEREKDFSEEFIAVARAIYQQNDRRAALKLRINRLLDSELREEKSYKAY